MLNARLFSLIRKEFIQILRDSRCIDLSRQLSKAIARSCHNTLELL